MGMRRFDAADERADASGDKSTRTMILEAFADTIVPGEKRSADDRAIAGVASGGGAVAAGAIELLEWDATGVTDGLDDIVRRLDDHARAYAGERDLDLDPGLPAFVALPFEDRTALVLRLLSRGHPEKEFWVLLTLFSNMAFDSAAHLHTAEAIAAGHPGLTAMGIARPDADGLWRFPEYSYRRPLARLHPDTTKSGSPA
jgi:enediyne biosynthesis protein E8